MGKLSSKQIIKSIRLPENIWNTLKDTSERNYRTLNSQILKILEDWLVEHNFITEEERYKND